MIRCFLCLSLCGVVACMGNSDPDAPVIRLSELMRSPKIMLVAGPAMVHATIEFDAHTVGACATLDDDFVATLDATPMTITNRGMSVDSIYAARPCDWPELQLANPPTAATASITMRYAAHTIVVDLQDRLAPRSAQPVPDGPWTFAPGQTVTLQWSPRSDFTSYTPKVSFTPASGTGSRTFVVTVDEDRMSFSLDAPPPGTLEITMQSGPDRTIAWPCQGATCTLFQDTQFTHAISSGS